MRWTDTYLAIIVCLEFLRSIPNILLVAELFVEFYELNEFQIRKHLIMSDSSMLKKTVSHSQKRRTIILSYIYI